ncbi:MAG: D-tyrosyl-tRNA(Tyr) deacylase [Bacteroidia bacterium]|jgi:D-tyrosyl-tRNA(Tyr) deacylase
MRALIQRVANASVEIDNQVYGHIDYGLLIFLGVEEADDQKDAEWLVRKITQMRILNDKSGVMNESVLDQNQGILVISQFTLHASTKKGNRPSYIRAARPETAESLYKHFILKLTELLDQKVQSGVFGANMQVKFTNDGPVTILLDTKNPE